MHETAKPAVLAILNAAGVNFSAAYVGQIKRGEWDCDQWRVQWQKIGAATASDYFTGLGCRAEPTAIAKQQAKHHFADGVTAKDISERTIYGRRYLAYLETLRKPQAPHAADVLYSMLSDSGAAEQTFSEWCADFGCSDDSIKARDTYFACQKSAETLRLYFNSEQLAALRDALQDY